MVNDKGRIRIRESVEIGLSTSLFGPQAPPSMAPGQANADSSLAGVAIGESENLVARCRAGDRQAFRELFVRHRTDVIRLVYRMLGPRPDVEDVVQEVFLQVYRSLVDFRGDAKFSTWLHRVTVNVVLMTRRAARSRPTFAGEASSDELALPAQGLLPDEDMVRREQLRAFQRCIDQLPEKKRTVFILHELEGMPAAEIARVVSAPVLTVRTRLFYARKEMLERMKSEPALAALAMRWGHSDGASNLSANPISPSPAPYSQRHHDPT